MTIDWDVYTEEIKEEMGHDKHDLMERIADEIIEHIDNKVYFFLEKMIPIIDLEKDSFTIRLSYDCFFNKEDDRNVLFNLCEEIANYDGGNFDRLDRLKEIFSNSINIVNAKIKKLEETWGRDET